MVWGLAAPVKWRLCPVPDDRRAAKDAALSGAARVLATLRYLGETPNGASLQQITAALDSPKTSVHRALGQLVAAGLVSQHHHTPSPYTHPLLPLLSLSYAQLDQPRPAR